MARANKIFLVIGARGTGKTEFLKNIFAKQKNLFPKALIVDTFDNDVWRNLKTAICPDNENINVPVIEVETYKRWQSGLGRIFSNKPKDLLNLSQEHAKNSTIIIEDSRKFIPSRLTDQIRAFFIDTKQKNIDLYLVFHSLNAVPPEVLTYTDILVLFKTNDGKPSSVKYPWGEIPVMMQRLKASGNRYENLTLQLN